MNHQVTLVGIDCGSTTTSAVVARARLSLSAGGQYEMSAFSETFRSPVVFTPFTGEMLDERQMEELLDAWFREAHLTPADIFGGGALITGLAARRSNANAIRQLIEARVADAVIAIADDPRLESWLAFMGNAHAWSLQYPDVPVLNIDIGGGTTNLAVGRSGQVLATGSLNIGARHFQFEPGTYRLQRTSPLGHELLGELNIPLALGQTLAPDVAGRIADFYAREILRSAGLVTNKVAQSQFAQSLVEAPLQWPEGIEQAAAIKLSGGVGRLVYEILAGQEPKNITPYGDLGVELAARIARETALVERLVDADQPNAARATVYGLLKHHTELSGATLYLPDPARLPLKDVPILGQLALETPGTAIADWMDLLAATGRAACLQVELPSPSVERVVNLGERLASALSQHPLKGATLVLLAPANVGKALGQYATRWGTLESDLIVIDEVSSRAAAQFVRLGKLRHGIVPIFFYGLRS
ncbi:MAG TPA: ethanolamine ammonia-lyase reactivating factor EutA [Pirellulales bacterium]|jgi:ethanolamine utilization protein EutA|nr:ethanolamine ammonia-lyase reactivating factor EutA [Pirellulales bacterium]